MRECILAFVDRRVAAGLLIALLAACGGGTNAPMNPAATTGTNSASKGQVAPPTAVAPLSFYAASRFAEQATFGPTPALVAEIRAKGFERWIDEQLAMPASQVDLTPYLGYDEPVPEDQTNNFSAEFSNLAIGAADQLRVRVAWALSQFIVVSNAKVNQVGTLYWMNFLLRQATGRYDELLYTASIHPAMGHFLDNVQNRPRSAACPTCVPNENFARELMQLFSLGVFKLNADGSPQRNANGQFQETYTQRDVEQLARVLTGWQYDPDPPNRRQRNFGNWAKLMVPSTYALERDSGRKEVLGRVFPAGQSAPKDLRDAIDLLMAHPNIAPFVALRLIQHLVKSNPTPAYLTRISGVFRDNGNGVAGDLKAVVKAILLDPEARAGDSAATARADDGKLREPFLYQMAIWRGLECARTPRSRYFNRPAVGSQQPFAAPSVFSFYAPTDRAPVSNLLAPERGLLVTTELRERLYQHRSVLLVDPDELRNRPATANFTAAECALDAAVSAYRRGPDSYAQWLSERYFRGAMAAPLRASLRAMNGFSSDATEDALTLLELALFAPSFGAQR